jgi:hypothetical protein
MKKFGRKRVLETVFLYCNKHGDSEHVLAGIKFKKWKCCACTVDYSAVYRKKRKKMAVDYKGGKCEICGYCRSIAVLNFHHTDPLLKEYNLSGTGLCKKWKTVAKELDKCQMLCFNCHHELHEKIDADHKISIQRKPTHYGRKQIHEINSRKLGRRISP